MQNGKRHIAFLPGLALLLLLAVGIAPVYAASTPAGTIIRNQGVVSFKSLAGEDFEASSNEIIMIVLPVFGITIVPDGTAAAPGQIQYGVAGLDVVFPYILTFTGNTQDSATIAPTFDFASSTFYPQTPSGPTGYYVYNDLNYNGVVDGTDVVVTSWVDADADNQIDAVEIQSFGLGKSYNPDEPANLLVIIKVPAGTPSGRIANFGIDGASTGDVTKTDTGNVSRALTVNDAVMVVRKSANPEHEVTGGNTVAYSVTAANSGTNTAVRRNYTVDVAGVPTPFSGVLLYDVLPTDQDTGLPLAIALPAPTANDTSTNLGTIIYSDRSPIAGDPTTWNWYTIPPAVTTVIGYITSNGGGTNYDIPVGATVSLAFSVTAPLTRQTFQNQAHFSYLDNTGPTVQTSSSNIVYTLVTPPGGYGVVIRDTDYLASPPPKTPPDDGGGVTNDFQTQANGLAGTFVYFTNRVENTGGTDDTFNITIAGVPAGWTAVILKADGVSPLNDTGFDGIFDTGSMIAGDTRDLVIRVAIPANQPTAAVPANIVVTATSVADPTKTDSTADTISATTASSMNLANTDAAKAVIEALVSKTTNAGSYADFPLIVQNTAAAGGAYDTYTMSTPVLPAGWGVVFYLDANENAVLDDSELIPTLQTNPVAAAGYAMLIARVLVPTDSFYDSNTGTPLVQDPYGITFAATSANNGASDSIADEVFVNPGDAFEIHPNLRGTIEPGGVVTYTHEVVNRGSRPNRFYLTLALGTPTWNYLIYDQNMTAFLPVENVMGVDLPYVDLTEAGGALDKVSFTIKIFAPANTPVGTMDVSRITATARDFGIALAPTVIDTTQVVAGDLILTKSSVPAPSAHVQPGDNIAYTTTYFNKGAIPLYTFVLYDQISPFTSYVLQSGSTVLPAGLTGAAFQVSRDGGISWTNDNVGAGPDATVTNVRVVFTGALESGLTGSATFSVRVK